MSDTPNKKTLEQITQDVLNSQFGISEADLSLLFDDTSTDKTKSQTTPTTTPSEVTVTEPATAEPAPAISVVPTPIIPSVTPPEPNRPVETVPDKSKDLESSLNAQKEQIATMQQLLQELVKRTQATDPATTAATRPTVPNPLDEIDDQQIIEKPKEIITKLVQGILKMTLPAAFAEYDSEVTKRQVLDQFRRDHNDFDELRPIMRQIVLENPTMNDRVDALPRIYQEAKDRKVVMLEAMRKELNIPVVPSAPPVPTQPAVSEEDMLAKLEQRIVEKIRKRRAALAATSPTTEPVTPVNRQTPIQREVPKTPVDEMFEAMLKAGNPSTGFLRNVETVKK